MSSQCVMVSRAASMCLQRQFKDDAEVDCLLSHLRNSVRRTFGNRCRWQGRTVVGEEEGTEVNLEMVPSPA